MQFWNFLNFIVLAWKTVKTVEEKKVEYTTNRQSIAYVCVRMRSCKHIHIVHERRNDNNILCTYAVGKHEQNTHIYLLNEVSYMALASNFVSFLPYSSDIHVVYGDTLTLTHTHQKIYSTRCLIH